MNFLKKNQNYFIFVLFGAVFLFLAFNRHSRRRYYSYQSEIWADKAGYYVYLPAFTKFEFKADLFPDSVDTKTGNGFILRNTKNKVQTKYTYGVALLQLPFYLISDLFAGILGYERNGFSPPYHWMINCAAVFYLLLGLFYLKKVLSTKYSAKVVWLTLFLLASATHLYYYFIDETGMSHVYSFALFSIVMYLFETKVISENRSVRDEIVFGLLSGLLVLIRPTNLIFLVFLFFLNINNLNDLKTRIHRTFNPRFIIVFLLSWCLIYLPQFLYWYYLTGNIISYSYGHEAFEWLNPKIMQTWFAPHNGLFLYTPFYLLIVVSVVWYFSKNKIQGALYLGYFIFLSYLLSCWWDRSFGCSFGARSFVEHLVVFSIPIAGFLQAASKWNRTKKSILCFVVLVILVFNLKLTYTFGGCFKGKSTWDWKAYSDLVFSPTK